MLHLAAPPIFHIERASARLIALRPALIIKAASTAIGTSPTRPGMIRTMTSIHAPCKTPDQRVRAPTLTLSAVWPTDPPAGIPEKRPLATLAAPCANKSFEGLTGLPSGFFTLWLTPAPCTAITTASDRAERNRSVVNSSSRGNAGAGMP